MEVQQSDCELARLAGAVGCIEPFNGAKVTAGWEYWASLSPMSGQDYVRVNASTITVDSNCSPNPLVCP